MVNSSGQRTDGDRRRENKHKDKSWSRGGRSKIEQGEKDIRDQSPSYPVKHGERVKVRFTEEKDQNPEPKDSWDNLRKLQETSQVQIFIRVDLSVCDVF